MGKSGKVTGRAPVFSLVKFFSDFGEFKVVDLNQLIFEMGYSIIACS